MVGKESKGSMRVLGREEGFTLIELLVVVIIIGILAAIAIPTYLAQREQAQSAAVQSDLRNAATAATACAVANAGSYEGCDKAKLTADFDFNESAGVEVEDGPIDKDRWSASAHHSANPSKTVYHFDTADGAQVKKGPLGS